MIELGIEFDDDYARYELIAAQRVAAAAPPAALAAAAAA